MKIVKQNAQYMSKEGVTPYEFIERVGRTCYKSEDKISDGSAEKFVESLLHRNHYAMIEHYNVILQCTKEFYYSMKEHLDTTYLHMTDDGFYCVVSGSFRAWRDVIKKGHNSLQSGGIEVIILKVLHAEFKLVFDDLFLDICEGQFDVVCDPESPIEIISEKEVLKLYSMNELIMEHITHTFLFTTDRGVTHELVRHRPCSFAQESQRYCNYSKGKFGEEITVIEPFFFIGEHKTAQYGEWETSCRNSERAYFNLINLGGCTPQEARTVLPNSVKADIIMTATESEWQHVVDLRLIGTTGAPHPQMRELMWLAQKDLMEKSDWRIVTTL